MTSDLCTDDVVVCIASPQVISSEGVSTGGGGRVAASSAAVELGRRLLLAARAGNTPQVLDLMAKGAPFTTDWLGTSPLHLAAGGAHAGTCAVLLRAGVSRDARTKVERTPLHMAAYAGHADVVSLLLQHDAAVDCRDMLRMTPLHWAAQRGHTEAVSALLAAGCELAPLSKFGKTPRQLAAAAGHADVLQLLDQAAVQRQQQAERKRTISVTAVSTEATPTTTWRTQRAGKDKSDPAEDTDANTQGFQPIHRLQEIKTTNIKIKPQQDKTTTNESKTETRSSGDSSSAAALLRRHGITLLPADDGSTVLSALQSGRTVVLSDAGKLMLKESSPPQSSPGPQPPQPPAPAPGPAEPATPTKGLKLITLNNKLLLHNNKPLGKNNIQLSQVKLVQLKDKLSSPKRPQPLAAPRRRATPVKIIVNKHNYQLLSAAQNQQSSAGSPSQQSESGAPGAGAAGDERDSLRSQLQAARKAIAALTAELASCKARLAQLEQRQA